MVQASTYGVAEASERKAAEPKGANYARLGLIAAASLGVCAMALVSMPEQRGVELLKGDAESVAGKVLASQHFHKANHDEKVEAVTHVLKSKSAEGKSIISKIAKVAADKHESYHERMAAMKKLLDGETDNLKSKPLKMPSETADKPKSVEGKSSHRGRAEEAADNAKAIADGEKLMHHVQKASGKSSGGHKLEMSKKDKEIKEQSEKSSADPKTMDMWMKDQAAKTTAHKKHALKKAAEAKIASNKAAKEAKEATKEANSANPPAAGSSYSKLVAWAEAHGLPKKLADNPADSQKVHDIIARMKADAEVEKIKAQMHADDAKVGEVVHGADPGAAGMV